MTLRPDPSSTIGDKPVSALLSVPSNQRPRPFLQFAAFFAVFIVWALVHFHYWSFLIYHDSWKHNFPGIYDIGRNSSCGHLARWLMSPDTGSPTILYAISYGLTQPFRILTLFFFACVRPDVPTAMLIYKLEIFSHYLGVTLGMFVLGRMLFRHWLSPLYLAASTLFAGMCLDALHSDQVATIIFWVPWCVGAWVLADRHAGTSKGVFYLNLSVLFFCLESLDQYPHFSTLAAAFGLLIYGALRRERLRLILGQWRRFWPAGIVLLVTATQLLIVQQRIYEYLPSLRTSITVDPSLFDPTGFVQPSSFFGAIFPLTFTAAFKQIAAGFSQTGNFPFIFRLDILVLYFGTLPLLLILSLFVRPGMREQKIGWLAFASMMLLVSLQQTRIYLLLFHVPFFDVFRSYFLYIDYVVVGILILSAYGFERIVTAPLVDRAKIIQRTVRIGAVITLILFLALAFVARQGDWSNIESVDLGLSIAIDVVLLAAAFLALGGYTRWLMTPSSYGLSMIAVLVFTQSLYTMQAYRLLAVPTHTILADYHLTGDLARPYSADELAQPMSITRPECPTFGSCYLAQRDVASLRRDLDGSFLRHRANPVLREELLPGVAAMMVGVTHPLLWASAMPQPIASLAKLDETLNRQASNIDEVLGRKTFVVGFDVATGGRDMPLADLTVTDWQQGTDRVAFHYRAAHPALVNFEMTKDPGWSATVNGINVPLLSGNYDTISLWVGDGDGEVVLRFHSPTSDYFFWSRWILVACGLASIFIVIMATRVKRMVR